MQRKQMKKVVALCLTGALLATQPTVSYASDTTETNDSMGTKLGEQVNVNTDYGEFELTVEQVRTCDWVERGGDDSSKLNAVLIECDVKNISFNDPYNNVFWLQDYMSVLDDNGYVVENLSYSYDDGEYDASPEIPIGARCKVVVPYKVKKDVKSLKININKQVDLECEINFGDIIQENIETELANTNDYEAQIQALKEENEGLKAQVKELETKNKDLQEKVDSLTKKNKKLKTQLEEAQKEKATTEENKEESDEETQVDNSTIEEKVMEETTSTALVEYTDKTTTRIVQQALNEAGYNCGTPDGIAGAKTAEAISAYQTVKSITVNGKITDELLKSLGIEEKVKAVIEAEGKKNEYSPDYTYEQLARNPDSYMLQKIKFSGKVIQVGDDGSGTNYARVKMNSNSDTIIFVTYNKSILDYRLLDDDMITVYGKSYGVYSYQSTGAGTITIPWIDADIIEM